MTNAILGSMKHRHARNLFHSPGMLVHNYRSHSRLLELPSRLYYDNSLVASADPSLVAAPPWDELQDPNDPIGVNDQEQHLNKEEQHAEEQLSGPKAGNVDNYAHEEDVEGLAVEEEEVTGEEGHGVYGEEEDGYSEEEEGGVEQLPVNTLFYGIRGQQVPFGLTTQP